jgi:hypothetical protein
MLNWRNKSFRACHQVPALVYSFVRKFQPVWVRGEDYGLPCWRSRFRSRVEYFRKRFFFRQCGFGPRPSLIFLQISEFGAKAGLHFFKHINCEIFYILVELICFRKKVLSSSLTAASITLHFKTFYLVIMKLMFCKIIVL